MGNDDTTDNHNVYGNRLPGLWWAPIQDVGWGGNAALLLNSKNRQANFLKKNVRKK